MSNMISKGSAVYIENPVTQGSSETDWARVANTTLYFSPKQLNLDDNSIDNKTIISYDEIASKDQLTIINDDNTIENIAVDSVKKITPNEKDNIKLLSDGSQINGYAFDNNANSINNPIYNGIWKNNNNENIDGIYADGVFEDGNIKVAKFDGNSYIDCGIIDTDVDEMWVSFWMKWDGKDGAIPVGFKNYALYIKGSNLGWTTNNDDLYGVSFTADEYANEWVHIVANFKTSEYGDNLYINGVKQTVTQKIGSIKSENAAIKNVKFQVSGFGADTSHNFEGFMNHINVFKRKLSDVEIEKIYKHNHLMPNDIVETIYDPALKKYTFSGDGKDYMAGVGNVNINFGYSASKVSFVIGAFASVDIDDGSTNYHDHVVIATCKGKIVLQLPSTNQGNYKLISNDTPYSVSVAKKNYSQDLSGQGSSYHSTIYTVTLSNMDTLGINIYMYTDESFKNESFGYQIDSLKINYTDPANNKILYPKTTTYDSTLKKYTFSGDGKDYMTGKGNVKLKFDKPMSIVRFKIGAFATVDRDDGNYPNTDHVTITTSAGNITLQLPNSSNGNYKLISNDTPYSVSVTKKNYSQDLSGQGSSSHSTIYTITLKNMEENNLNIYMYTDQSFSDESFGFQIRSVEGTDKNIEAILPNPVACYPFDGNVKDMIYNYNSQWKTGDLVYGEGRYEQAVLIKNKSLDNYSTQFESGYPEEHVDEFSVSFWFKQNSSYSNRANIAMIASTEAAYDNSDWKHRWDFYINPDNLQILSFVALIDYDNNIKYNLANNEEIELNKWYFVSFSYKNNDKFYGIVKDETGKIILEKTINNPQGKIKSGFALGRADDYYNDNYIDEVNIFDYALTANEINKLYNTKPVDLTAYYPFDGDTKDNYNNYDGTIDGSVTFVPGIVGKAAKFDGSDSHIKVPKNIIPDTSKPFSVSMYVKISDVSKNYVVFSNRNGTYAKTNDIEINKTKLIFNNGDGTNNNPLTLDCNFNTTDWFNIVKTYDGEYVKAYVNGKYLGKIASNIYDSGEDYYIGSENGDSTYAFEGLIDEVKIFDNALTEKEIALFHTTTYDSTLKKYTFSGDSKDYMAGKGNVKLKFNTHVNKLNFKIGAFASVDRDEGNTPNTDRVTITTSAGDITLQLPSGGSNYKLISNNTPYIVLIDHKNYSQVLQDQKTSFHSTIYTITLKNMKENNLNIYMYTDESFSNESFGFQMKSVKFDSNNGNDTNLYPIIDSKNPVACYTLNNNLKNYCIMHGGQLLDTNGIIHGDVTFVSGKTGKAAKFDVNSYFQTKLLLNRGYTVNLWIKGDYDGRIAGASNSSDNGNDWNLLKNGFNGGYCDATWSYSFDADKFYMITYLIPESGKISDLKVFINGSAQSISVTSSDKMITQSGNNYMKFGTGATNSQTGKGVIQNIVIFSRLLTTTEINGLYAGDDQTKNNSDKDLIACYPFNGDFDCHCGLNYGIANENITFTQGDYEPAAKFNGNSYIAIDDFNVGSMNAVTFTFWANSKQSTTFKIMGANNVSNDDFALVFDNGTDLHPYFRTNMKDSSKISNAFINDGTWHFYAVSFNSTGFKFWRDGKLINDNGSQPISTTSSKFRIGNVVDADGNNFYYKGLIDQVRIFDRELYTYEIQSIMQRKPLNTSANIINTLDILGDNSCIACYQFDGNTKDLSGNHNASWVGGDGQAVYAPTFFGKGAVVHNGDTSHGGDNKCVEVSEMVETKSAFTYSAWVDGDIGNSSDTYTYIFQDKGNDDINGISVMYSNDSESNKIRLHLNKKRVDEQVSEGIDPTDKFFIATSWDKTKDNGIPSVYFHNITKNYEKYIKYTSLACTTDLSEGLTVIAGITSAYADRKKTIIDQVRIFNRGLTLYEMKKVAHQKITDMTEILDVFDDGSCLACYNLNGDATDLSGKYNGTWKGSSATYAQGVFGKGAVIYNRNNTGHIEVPEIPTKSAFTYSAWVDGNTGDNGTYTYIFETKTNSKVYGLVLLYSNNGSQSNIIEVHLNGKYKQIGIGKTLDPTDTVFVAVRWDKTKNNGIPTAFIKNITKGYVKIIDYPSLACTSDLSEGINNIAGIPTTYAKRRKIIIDQVRVFNRSLSNYDLKILASQMKSVNLLYRNCDKYVADVSASNLTDAPDNVFQYVVPQVYIDLKEKKNQLTNKLTERLLNVGTSGPSTVDTLDIFGDKSCIACYQFNGDVKDLSGNYNGTLGNDATFITGKFDKALNNNGGNDRQDTAILSEDGFNGLFDTDNFTISMYAKIKNVTTSSKIYNIFVATTGYDAGNGGNRHIGIRYLTQGSLDDTIEYVELKNDNDNSSSAIEKSFNITPDNNWHHFIISKAGANVTIYVDGHPINSFTSFTNVPGKKYVTVLGKGGSHFNNDIRASGAVDQVRIFNRGITYKEAQTLFSEKVINPLANLDNGLIVVGKPDTGSKAILNYGDLEQEVDYTVVDVDKDEYKLNIDVSTLKSIPDEIVTKGFFKLTKKSSTTTKFIGTSKIDFDLLVGDFVISDIGKLEVKTFTKTDPSGSSEVFTYTISFDTQSTAPEWLGIYNAVTKLSVKSIDYVPEQEYFKAVYNDYTTIGRNIQRRIYIPRSDVIVYPGFKSDMYKK